MADLDQTELLELLGRARKRIETLESEGISRKPVAVIGLACRFPGADNSRDYWENLSSGVDCVGPLRDGRWDTQTLVSDGERPVAGQMLTADGGWLENVRSFDPAFFGISGREAKAMDPQQRLLLQTCWHALEDAGLVPADLSGSATGVFVGISSNDYGALQAGKQTAQQPWAGTGNALSIAANRLSYLLNLRGPSMAIDTACSSSLVALHHGVRSLRAKESTLAIIAGVNVLLNPDLSVAFSQAGMMSPTGRCRTFDEAADGYVRSEGVGALVLKHLDAAEQDGDNILAVIAGSAVNQDGRGNGLTAPNGPAQESVVAAALSDAGTEVERLAYIEAHGTGTPLGDPIEFNSLSRVLTRLASDRSIDKGDDDTVLVGSAKAFIGHTEAAAGMAGVIKTILSMQAGVIPAQLHLSQLNPRLTIAADTPLRPVLENTAWPAARDSAGVSAFGFGGTNAHVVLRRYQTPQSTNSVVDLPSRSVLTLTANSPDALKSLSREIAEHPPADLCDLAASLAQRRTSHPYRLALPISNDDTQGAVVALKAHCAGDPGAAITARRLGPRPPRLVFAYSGQGAQRVGMGRQLYESSAIYRQALDNAAEWVLPTLDIPLQDLMFEDQSERLAQTAYTQPAMVAMQFALTEMLADAGVQPDAVMGFSLGEYTAAMVAGVLPAQTMLPLVSQRGQLIQTLPAGGNMASFRAPRAWVAERVASNKEVLAISAEITHELVVVAGQAEALLTLMQQAESDHFKATSLSVSHAFHSPLMEPILPKLQHLFDNAEFNPLQIPLISNLDGREHAAGTRLDTEHWLRHTREAVQFGKSIATLADDPSTLVLEIGPDSTICTLGRETALLDSDRFVATLSRRADDQQSLERALAAISAHGIDLGSAFLGRGSLAGNQLPLYPFDTTAYWFEEKPVEPERLSDSVMSAQADRPNLALVRSDDQRPGVHHQDAEPQDQRITGLMQRQLALVNRTINDQMQILSGYQAQGSNAQLSASEALSSVAPDLSLPDVSALSSSTTASLAIAESVSTSEAANSPPPLRAAATILWVLAQKNDHASRAYNIPVLLQLHGVLDVEKFNNALVQLFARHPMLRAVFPAPEELVIRSMADLNPAIEFSDGSDWDDQQRTAWVEELGETLFDVTADTLLRVRLLKLRSDCWLLSLESHHLVSDGLTINILLRELSALYNNNEDKLAQPASYIDFLYSHQRLRQSDAVNRSRDYWIKKLGDGVHGLDLALYRSHSGQRDYRAGHVLQVFDSDLSMQLRSAANSLGLTPFMLFYAVFGAVLSRLSGQAQVPITIPVAGREAQWMNNLVGYCSDLICTVCEVDLRQSLAQFSRTVRTDLLADLDHQRYSFAWLAADLRARDRELPLQVVFNYQNAYVDADFNGLSTEVQPRPIAYIDAELTLNAIDVEQGLALELNYDKTLYREELAQMIVCALSASLRAIAMSGTDCDVASLPLLSSKQFDVLKLQGQGESTPLAEHTVHDRIQSVAEQQPDAIALRHADESVSYAELCSRSQRLAAALQQQGVCAGDAVGICLPRSVDVVIAQLAVNYAGGYFVYLDPGMPIERLQQIVVQAGIGHVISREFRAMINGALADKSIVELGPDAAAEGPLSLSGNSGDLMYVIFTSGSTGTPKGVMIEHRSVVNYTSWLGRTLGVDATDVILQFSALGFDTSIEEIYTALMHGATLVFRDDVLPVGAEAFWTDIRHKGVSVLDLPTAFWHSLMLEPAALAHIPASLRHVIIGGEAARPEMVRQWTSKVSASVGLWNTYGPTETTIVCLAAALHLLSDDKRDTPVPIGQPVANAQVLVLDEALQPLPSGAVGSLYIGGDTLARGYLGRGDLTREAFITLPCAEGKFYRSNDLVRWREDGLLEYHGRADTQIKIRGFRIEAQEIERTMESFDEISSALIKAEEVNGINRLAAFLVSASAQTLNTVDVRQRLAQSLPEYMVPQAFVQIERLPLNRNGKVDRGALPAIDWSTALGEAAQKHSAQSSASGSGIATRSLSDTEQILAGVWSEILGVDVSALTADSDFFAAGGDSLSAMRVLSTLKSRHGTSLTARDFFHCSTLGELAAAIQLDSTETEEPSIVRLDRHGPLPLSSAQKRLWFLHALDPDSGTYNLPSRIDLHGPLDQSRVSAALAAIVARHESMRTRLRLVDDVPCVQILPHDELNLEYLDLSDLADRDKQLDKAALALAVKPFELNGGTLMRAGLYRLADDHHALLMCAHHIITDGWSMSVLAHDFARAYEQGALPELPLQYVDYAAHQQAVNKALDREPLLRYWRTSLADLPALLELPTDYARSEEVDGRGRVHYFDLDKELAAQVRECALQLEVTPFALLQSVFGVLLARLTGQGAFAMGTVTANRPLAGSENVIGFFADTLALRFDATDNPGLDVLSRRQQQTLLDAMRHSALPFEAIVEDLVTDRTDRYPPIFQTMFVWQNTPSQVQSAGELQFTASRLDKGATQYDLVLDMTETDNGISAMLEYRLQLFEHSSIERLADQFRCLLIQALLHPQLPVGELAFFERPVATAPYPLALDDLRVDSIMDQHAVMRPESTALIFEAGNGRVERYSWSEFEQSASHMADALHGLGVRHGDSVAICARRCSELMFAIYAVMKAGAAYVPLDPDSPAERQQRLLKASGAGLLLTQRALEPLFIDAQSQSQVIPCYWLDEPLPVSSTPHQPSTDSSLPIYIIFTSGTTGMPKGVVVPHRGVANMARGMGEQLGISADDRLLQFAPLNFDASALQIFVPLLAGGTCVLHHQPGQLGAGEFMDLSDRHQLSVLDLPAALWRQWVDTMTEEGMRMARSIRIFLTGGEALNRRTMQKWALLCDRDVQFLSSYGPTEASITAAIYQSSSDTMRHGMDVGSDIGYPLPNVGLHILDLYGGPAAPGVIGEIAISGPGVAIGYLNDEAKTNAAFINHPDFGRLYKTGDFGRIKPDQSFEFHGRRDAQIKIRGFRVEPGEIEAAIIDHPAIAQALVTTRKSEDGRTQLVAYAVPEQAQSATVDLTPPADLNAHMQSSLAAHMVPMAVMMLPEFPLLPSGKINRRQLPLIDPGAHQQRGYVAPEGAREQRLARIWSELLNVDQVGRYDNFFTLGGDSILSLQVAARARREGLVFDVRDVFQQQTLAALAGTAKSDNAVVAEQGRVCGSATLSDEQRWILQHSLEADRSVIDVPETIGTDTLQQAVNWLLEHHDVLRADIVNESELHIPETLSDSVWHELEQNDILREMSERVIQESPCFTVLWQPGRSQLTLLTHPALLDDASRAMVCKDLVYFVLNSITPDEITDKESTFKESTHHRILDNSAQKQTKTASVLQLSALVKDSAYDKPMPDVVQCAYQRQRYSLSRQTSTTLKLSQQSVYQVNTADMLAAAWLLVNAKQNEPIKLQLQADQRRVYAQRIDLSRTAGYFTDTLITCVSVKDDVSPRAVLLAAKEHLRAPGYEPISADIADRPYCQIRQALPAADMPWGIDFHIPPPLGACSLALAFDSVSGELVIDYRDDHFSTTEIDALAENISLQLDALVQHCQSDEAGGLSPSDVPLADVTQAELDELHRQGDFEDVYNASFGQAGMLFHSRLAPDTGAFLLHTVIEFDAALDIECLKLACSDLIRQHAALRSSFVWGDRQHPLLRIARDVELPWHDIDFSHHRNDDALNSLIARDRVRAPDFGVAPLMRLTLVRKRDGYALLWLKHHAVVDGWSMSLLYDDLVRFYERRRHGQTASSTSVITQSRSPAYADYIAWLRHWDRQAAERHWQNTLSDFAAATELGVGRNIDSETGEVAIACEILDATDYQRLQTTARQHGVTASTLVQAAWALLLSHYSGQRDVLFGVTVSGRPADLPQAQQTVGMFLNALPLRVQIPVEMLLWDWLLDIQNSHLANDQYGHLSLIDIQRFSAVPAGERLMESMVIFQNTPPGETMSGAGDSTLQQHVKKVSGFQKSNYPLTLFAEGETADLDLSLNYDPGRLDADDMQQLLRRLHRVLLQMIKATTVSELGLLDGAQREAAYQASVGPTIAAPDTHSLIHLFKQQVRDTPERIAVFSIDTSLSYLELDQLSDTIAASLIGRGIKAGQVVALLLERSALSNAVLLGIMKAGAVFLALDREYPMARLCYMLRDSKAALLIHEAALADELADAVGLFTKVSDLLATPLVLHETPWRALTPESLAYLIYTSGSTGEPKGVRALHRGALNRLNWMWREMPFDTGEVMVQKTALSFVDSVWEVFGPLLKGVPSLVLDGATVRDVPRFTQTLAEHNVTRLVLVPTLLRAMLDSVPDLASALPKLKVWICSGEALTGDLVKDFRQATHGARLINLYGSSEVAADVSWFDTADTSVDDLQKSASLGRPIDNTRLLLLSHNRQLVPDGLPGELFIGGPNLADGYWQKPQLTREAFVPNPYGDGLLFRSRDWARREPDGTISFLGRQDGQIKIRGMRVELAEIESVLRTIDGVDIAVVINRPASDNRARVVAYYSGSVVEDWVYQSLAETLPAHMMPALLLQQPRIPLLPNGKVNRRALPDPDAVQAVAANYAAPETDAEVLLAGIWADLLNRDVETISRNDSYFRLGGDSITSMQVAARIADQGLSLEIRDIFEAPTLAALATRVQGMQSDTRITLSENFPVLPLMGYRVLELHDQVETPVLRHAVMVLQSRHELLRAELGLDAGQPVLGVGVPIEGDLQPAVVFDFVPVDSLHSRLRIAAHPSLLDALAWQVMLSDLQTLLGGGELTVSASSLAACTPLVPSHSIAGNAARGMRAFKAAVFEDDQLSQLYQSAGYSLRASVEELIATALVYALREQAVCPDVLFIRACRPPGENRHLLTHRERYDVLPLSSGDLLKDLLAVKTALRTAPEHKATISSASLTVRLFGSEPVFNRATWKPVPQLFFADDPPQLELTLSERQLLIRSFPSFDNTLAERMVSALQGLIERSCSAAPSVWCVSDFPLADLTTESLPELASRYPDLQTVYRLTPGQTGMVFHAQVEPASAVYSLHTHLRFKQGLRRETLQSAFDATIARHEVLRSCIDLSLAKQPLQVVLNQAVMPLTVIDHRHLDDEQHKRQLNVFLDEDKSTPVVLTLAPLMRATLVLAPDGSADLSWMAHHAIIDGWSLPVMFRELMVSYDNALGLPGESLPEAVAFSSYIEYLSEQNTETALNYWRDTVGAVDSGTDLVIGRGADAENGVFKSTRLNLSDKLSRRLEKLASDCEVTLSTVTQAAWAALLARFNQAEQQVFGVTVSGRPASLPGVERAVGPFVNVLPLVVPTQDTDSIDSWLQSIQSIHRNNDANNSVSFQQIQSLCSMSGGERLCDSMIVFQNFPVDDRLLENAQQPAPDDDREPAMRDLVLGIQGHQTTSYAITLFIVPGKNGIEIEIIYDSGRFSTAQISALTQHFKQVFVSMVNAGTVCDIEVLDTQQANQMLSLGYGAVTLAPIETTLWSLFSAQVRNAPRAPALYETEQTVDYSSLDTMARQVATSLVQHGIDSGDIVALHLPRSADAIAVLLGISKAGAAWLALDPAYPADRLTYMLNDSGARLLVHDGSAMSFHADCTALNLKDIFSPPTTSSTVALNADTRAETDSMNSSSLAYLIYTSGSTGQPKGVRATHRALLNRLHWMWRELPYDTTEVGAIKTALSFVDSVAEIFGPLLQGVPSLLIANDDVIDINRFIEQLDRYRVSRLVLVPSLLRAMLDMPGDLAARLPHLRTWVVSGEACTAELVSRFRSSLPQARLLNFYGSSEVAGDVTWFDCSDMDLSNPLQKVPIGRPIDRSRVYILDRRRRPVPAGLPGELYVGGDNLADGYVGQPELTDEAFIRASVSDGERIYRTQDWARWNADKQIEFLGRQDGQIKIRGMRVEIGEVETVLRAQPGADDAVVKAVAAAGNSQQLAAWWSGNATEAELRAALQASLPAHMVPDRWTAVEAMPLLPNGKIDRRALQLSIGTPSSQAVVPARSPSPWMLAELRPLWSTLLETPSDELSIEQDFFASGGHSLLAARAIAEIKARTRIQLTLRQFYENASLSQIVLTIEDQLLESVSEEHLQRLIEEAQAEWPEQDRDQDTE